MAAYVPIIIDKTTFECLNSRFDVMAGLEGKVVLITGASSGIGAATALHLASLGCKLAIVARSNEKLQDTADKCKSLGSPDVLVLTQDLSAEGSCENVVEATTQHFGGLDVLVNNAGVMYTSNLQKVTSDQFDHSMNLNVKAAMVSKIFFLIFSFPLPVN